MPKEALPAGQFQCDHCRNVHCEKPVACSACGNLMCDTCGLRSPIGVLCPTCHRDQTAK